MLERLKVCVPVQALPSRFLVGKVLFCLGKLAEKSKLCVKVSDKCLSFIVE